ncbi:hypothetical protein THAOC_16134 [Thalassiosira oceanica]|uniref:Uncharacterized protein n=1 Tax=Thalassiosira oceanica TaxID=159749 RepID=K0SAX7_THAOC|nr:hypothetical protein THAOC_16134 [Thalassiosira oceanica]|eukprot:EJK63228.1 hypothetical protein THAOC_16134 [Thalassiosira oceanica]
MIVQPPAAKDKSTLIECTKEPVNHGLTRARCSISTPSSSRALLSKEPVNHGLTRARSSTISSELRSRRTSFFFSLLLTVLQIKPRNETDVAGLKLARRDCASSRRIRGHDFARHRTCPCPRVIFVDEAGS